MTTQHTHKPNWRKRGSTLIELLIAVMVVGTVVTAVAAGVTSSVKNTAESRYREIAISLGQQAIEVVRKERAELGWINFYNALSDTIYCVPAGAVTIDQFTTDISNCVVVEANTNFSRTVTVSRSGNNAVYAHVEVSWERGPNQPSQITLTQEFKDIDRN